MLKDTQDSKKR